MAGLKMILVHDHFGRNRWVLVLVSLRSFREGYRREPEGAEAK